jgi:hypothetical protein
VTEAVKQRIVCMVKIKTFHETPESENLFL